MSSEQFLCDCLQITMNAVKLVKACGVMATYSSLYMQLIESLTSSSFMLWGSKPLTVLSTTDLLPGDSPAQTNNTKQVEQPASRTAAQPAPDNAALTSHLFRRSEGGNVDSQVQADSRALYTQQHNMDTQGDDTAGVKTSLWTTASQHAGAASQHGRDLVPGSSHARDARQGSKWKDMPITVHASSFWWFKGAVDIATKQEGRAVLQIRIA